MISKFASASFSVVVALIMSLVVFSTVASADLVIPSTMLRAPFDVWEHTFHLRKAYTDIVPIADGTELSKGGRYVHLDPLSFARNFTDENDRQHNEPADPSDPFWSGRAMEDPTMFIQFDHKAIETPTFVAVHNGVPLIDKNKKPPNPLLAIQVVLNREAWGVGCFHAFIRDLDTQEVISHSGIMCPEMSSRGDYITLSPIDEAYILMVWANAGSHFWRITVEFERPEITTFSFIGAEGFSTEMIQSREKYDITPENASMGFKFMFQVGADEEENQIELWAFRKPPMPDFRLSLYVDNHPIFSESVHSVGQTAHAFGVRHIVDENQLASFVGKEVAMFATFVEARRDYRASLQVDDLAKILTPSLLESSSSSEPKEGQHYKEKILHIPSEELDHAFPDSQKKVEVVFRSYPSTNFVGLFISFPFPVKNPLVSLWVLEKEGGSPKKRTHLFLRESDADILHASTSNNHHLLYGWDDALPLTDNDGASSTRKFHQVLENPIEIEIQFDKIPESDLLVNPLDGTVSAKLSTVIENWVHNSGGDVHKLDLEFINDIHHSHAAPHPLKLKEPVSAWNEELHNMDSRKHAIAVIPFYNLFSVSLAMKSGWGNLISKHTLPLQQFLVEQKLRPESIQFFYLTLATLSHVYDGTHNFRPLFRLFEQSAINLPPLFHSEELRLFAFSESFIFERARMIKMWSAEYDVLTKLETKLRREISRDMYYFHRSQVEARCINGTNGEMQLVPVIDLAPHADAATAEVRYDEEDGSILLVAVADLKADTEVTVNYGGLTISQGAKETRVAKTQLGFLLQHGVVPDFASKSTGFVVKSKSGEDRIIPLFFGHPDSMDDYLSYLLHDGRFDDELTEQEREQRHNHGELFSAPGYEQPRQKLLEILEKKHKSLPQNIPDVSNEKLLQTEKQKHEANKKDNKHYQHHHSKHTAHKERPLSHLRATFDAARSNAMKLLESEKTTLEYFIGYLKGEHHSGTGKVFQE